MSGPERKVRTLSSTTYGYAGTSSIARSQLGNKSRFIPTGLALLGRSLLQVVLVLWQTLLGFGRGMLSTLSAHLGTWLE